MTIKEIKKHIRENELSLRAVRARSESTNDVGELRSINKELTELIEQRNRLEDQLYELESGEYNARTSAVNAAEEDECRQSQATGRVYLPGRGFSAVDGCSPNNEFMRSDKMNLKELNDKYEKRAADLREGKSAIFSAMEVSELRSIAVGSAGIVTVGQAGSELVPSHLQVGSIVDKVYNLPLLGGESYRQGYEISTPDAGVTAEGENSLDAEPTFGYSDITKLRFTSYAELTSQVIKLSPVQYTAYVMTAMQNSIRKVLSKHIVAGAGGTAGLAGLSTATTASGLVTAHAVTAIDGTTLDSIVFGYGGDLETGIATLVLRKADLAKFAAVRMTNGDPVYVIEFDAGNPNAGTISTRDSYKVPYVITDQLLSLGDVATASDSVCMVYGDLSKYFLVSFSDLEVMRSDDYQFKKGNVSFRGELYAGGNVCGYQAFSLIKKA